MTAADLVADLRSRGIAIVPRGTGISLTPRAKVLPADRTAVDAQRAAILALLTLDLHSAKEAVAVEEERRRAMAPAKKDVMFLTSRGFIPLRQLTVVEVRSLAGNGKLSAEEVNTWSLTHTTPRYR